MTELAANGLPDLDRRVFVPADDADKLVDAVRDQLAALQRELAAVEAAAARAEQQLAANGPAPVADDHVVADVTDAVASLRKAAELERTTALEHARARAAARVAEAQATAATARAAAHLGLDVPRQPAPEPDPGPVELTLVTTPPTIPLPQLPSNPVATSSTTPSGPKHASEPMPSGASLRVRTAQWPIPVEALLPMLALVMLLIVVLAWMG